MGTCWSAAKVCHLLNQPFFLSVVRACHPPLLTCSFSSSQQHPRSLCLRLSSESWLSVSQGPQAMASHSQLSTTTFHVHYWDHDGAPGHRACCPGAKEVWGLPSQNLPWPAHTRLPFYSAYSAMLAAVVFQGCLFLEGQTGSRVNWGSSFRLDYIYLSFRP